MGIIIFGSIPDNDFDDLDEVSDVDAAAFALYRSLHSLRESGDIDEAIRFATERANIVVSNTEAIPQVFVDAAR